MDKSAELDFDKSLKTKPDDNFFNIQSLLHISAKIITKFFYRTNVTPHQVIFISMLFGITASILIIQDNKILVIIGAVLLFYKNVFDKVDGSLARLKGLDSRRGRFYDSISDFIVTFSIFTAIAFYIYNIYQSFLVIVLVYIAMVFSMLQCSYFIFYQVSFIKITGKNTINRIIESINADDLKNEDKFTLFLQRIFLIIYGWQDNMIYKFDRFLFNRLKKYLNNDIKLQLLWYHDKSFLSIASALSIGTHMVLISVSLIFNYIQAYLFVNLILLNLLLISSVFYHFNSVKNEIKITEN